MTNPLEMSDEDFAKMAPPIVEVSASSEPEVKDPPKEETQEETPVEEPVAEIPAQGEEKEEEASAADPVELEEPAKTEETPALAPKKEETPSAEGKKEEEQPAEPEVKATEGLDFASIGKLVMTPFKANGKLIKLESADEAITLMQLGANYTKKMQAISHHKKFVMMLEQNGLLDEDKLSFYIDLDKGNPEALKKFLKDKKVDPVDLDVSGEVKYKAGSHVVTDQDATLASVIEEVRSTPTGNETLQSVASWDSTSKKELYENPEILSVIHSQHENGIYTRISAEVDRRKMLGQIPPNAPFLKAYKFVGDEMQKQGLFGTKTATPTQQPVTVKTPVIVRPAKSPVTKPVDASKVRAAAAPRSNPRPVSKVQMNPLAMSDEDFLKLDGKV